LKVIRRALPVAHNKHGLRMHAPAILLFAFSVIITKIGWKQDSAPDKHTYKRNMWLRSIQNFIPETIHSFARSTDT
jgi:hypothetical protein